MGDIPSSAYLYRERKRKRKSKLKSRDRRKMASAAGRQTHCRKGAVRGGCWVRAPLPAWGAGLGRGAGQGRAYPAHPSAALRGRRHKGKGIIQEGVHLLPRLFDGGLGGHVGRWGWGRVKHLVSRGGAALVWGQVRVRLYERGKENTKSMVEMQHG